MADSRRIRFGSALLVLAALAVLDTGCSSDDPVAPAGATVRVLGTVGFSHDSVDINAGQSVTWIWDASGHSVTSSNIVGGLPGCTPNGAFDSGLLNVGATFTHVFPTAGTFAYFCKAGTDCSTSFESAFVVVH